MRQWGLRRCQGRGEGLCDEYHRGGALILALKQGPNGTVGRDSLAGSPRAGARKDAKVPSRATHRVSDST